MQETCTCLRHTLWNLFKHYFVRLRGLKPAFGTLMQCLLDKYTFNIRIQCSVLEVPERIICN